MSNDLKIKIKLSNSSENGVDISNFVMSASISSKKENYKSILELEIITSPKLADAPTPKLGDIITITASTSSTSSNSIFIGSIVKIENKDLSKFVVTCYSSEWSFETKIASAYFEKIPYPEAIESLIKRYKGKVATDYDKSDSAEVTAMYLKKSFVEIFNDLLKKSKTGERYLQCKYEKSGPVINIPVTPKSNFLKNSIFNGIELTDKELSNFIVNFTESEDATEIKNHLIVYDEDYKIDGNTLIEAKNSNSIDLFGNLTDIFVGDDVKATEKLKDLSKIKKKITLSFYQNNHAFEVFNLVKIKDDFLKISESVYEIVEIKKKISNLNNNDIFSINTEATLELIDESGAPEVLVDIEITFREE